MPSASPSERLTLFFAPGARDAGSFEEGCRSSFLSFFFFLAAFEWLRCSSSSDAIDDDDDDDGFFDSEDFADFVVVPDLRDLPPTTYL